MYCCKGPVRDRDQGVGMLGPALDGRGGADEDGRTDYRPGKGREDPIHSVIGGSVESSAIDQAERSDSPTTPIFRTASGKAMAAPMLRRW